MSLSNLTAEQLQNFRPLHDRILIRRLPDMRSSTIVLTDKERSLRGEVLATGPGKYCCDHGRMRPVAVVPGQVVYFGQYSDYEEGDVLLITEADIKGVDKISPPAKSPGPKGPYRSGYSRSRRELK